MASGFIVLGDGRCFSPTSRLYDITMRAVADELVDSEAARTLREWLLSLLPGPTDADLGYGWIRSSDQDTVLRHLDLRELTNANQRLFYRAARVAGDRFQSEESGELLSWKKKCCTALADMVARAERGEPPLTRSDWTTIEPSKGRKLGPGW
jgi:hypothetical protein